MYIERCLTSLLRQENCNIIEVLVVDGGSTDDTVALICEMSGVHREIRLIYNPKRAQSAGVRADAHMTYALDFAKRCVEALRENAVLSYLCRPLVGRAFNGPSPQHKYSKMGNGGAAGCRIWYAPAFGGCTERRVLALYRPFDRILAHELKRLWPIGCSL